MRIIIRSTTPGLRGDFTLDGIPLSPEASTELQRQGYVPVEQDHPWWAARTRSQLGQEAVRLYEGFKP